MKKQTAVEWLLQAIEGKNGTEFSSYYLEFIEQAKAMEKEQIMNAYLEGESDADHYEDSASRFYNETYGGYK
jgi:hypothetical protein